MLFYLGTHQPGWLARSEVPLFVSRRRLISVVNLSPARTHWALDSGGFTELNMHGRWTVPPALYAKEVRRFGAQIGNMDWAAIQDWMCEEAVLKKTGLTVLEHQNRTIDSYLILKDLDPELPFAPVIQGWERQDYLTHVEMYMRRGIDLTVLPVVGVGSICRRQGTDMAEDLIKDLHSYGIKIHGFGFKTLGLNRVHKFMRSSDSMAWSFAARRGPILLPSCTGHKNCANCFRFAMLWREKLLSGLSRQSSCLGKQ